MQIIDVRQSLEFMFGHAKGAISMPLSKLSSDFEKVTKDLDKNSKVVVYCISGHRAGIATDLFIKNDYKKVENGINQRHVELNYL